MIKSVTKWKLLLMALDEIKSSISIEKKRRVCLSWLMTLDRFLLSKCRGRGWGHSIASVDCCCERLFLLRDISSGVTLTSSIRRFLKLSHKNHSIRYHWTDRSTILALSKVLRFEGSSKSALRRSSCSHLLYHLLINPIFPISDSMRENFPTI